MLLNYPANAWDFHSVYFVKEVVVEPHCEDGGCSVGAAMLSYLRVSRDLISLNQTFKSSSKYAFKGPSNPQSKIFLRKEKNQKRDLEKIAELISANYVVGICWGESEIGPRALGHRSIIANPKHLENWARINEIKSREVWRPFAPAVLEEDLFEFFEYGPPVSPFMNFNFQVKVEHRNKLAAITHHDSTSRVQTVDSSVEPLYSILKALKHLGLPPIVLNTSFNGPGQPIIQFRSQAREFLRQTRLDYLYTENGLKSN
jgi:carbamoyltransferase